jgi:hypothetical protein
MQSSNRYSGCHAGDADAEDMHLKDGSCLLSAAAGVAQQQLGLLGLLLEQHAEHHHPLSQHQ